MNSELVFTTPIFYDILDLDIKSIKEYCYTLRGQSDGRTRSNVLGWQSNDVQDDEDLKPMIDAINENLKEIHSYYKIKPEYELVVSNVWININYKHSFNKNHVHYNSFFSGSFYVEVPENSGNINFINPAYLQEAFVVPNFSKFTSLTEPTAVTWTYKPQPNMLIAFPSWLEHNVDQNMNDSDRISIAFNTDIVDKTYLINTR